MGKARNTILRDNSEGDSAGTWPYLADPQGKKAPAYDAIGPNDPTDDDMEEAAKNKYAGEQAKAYLSRIIANRKKK